MIIIDKGTMTFEVDVEETKSYYQRRDSVSGLEIMNFRKQVKESAPLLDEYLGEFGVDITNPDELCWCWKDEKGIFHYNVAYTIAGKISKAVQYEMILQDKSALHMVLETEHVPNEQTQPYFAFTVYNIEMSWILDEPYPEKLEPLKSSKQGLISKIVKKLKKC